MQKLFLRLDDASEYMDLSKWRRLEKILDRHNVKPLFGIIPANEDPNLLKYGKVDEFWDIVHSWIGKGWVPALHGYTHVFETNQGGINPVNKKSEYAGVPYERQLRKVMDGVAVLQEHGVDPKIFFAPAHTFDENTLRALKEGSNIRIISDTPANNVYCRDGITFVPLQAGHVRPLRFKTITYCYHPNTTKDWEFEKLNLFLDNNRMDEFSDFPEGRKASLYDILLRNLYFLRHSLRN
jgi:predicted deacetylase